MKANELTFSSLEAAKHAAEVENASNPKHRRAPYECKGPGKTVWVVATSTQRARALATFAFGIGVKNADPKTWSRKPLTEQVLEADEATKETLRKLLGVKVKK